MSIQTPSVRRAAPVRAWLGAALLAASLLPEGVAAQPSVTFKVFHGNRNRTEVIASDLGSGFVASAFNVRELILPRGTTVYVDVVNGNPFLYSYDLRVRKIPDDDLLPDLTKLGELIRKNLPAGGDVKRTDRDGLRTPDIPGWLQTYADSLSSVRECLGKVRTLLAASDEPRTPADVPREPTPLGRLKLDLLAVRSDSAGYDLFGRDLSGDLVDWGRQAEAGSQATGMNERVRRTLLDAMEGYGVALLAQREKVRKELLEAPEVRLEEKVEEHAVSIRLCITRRDRGLARRETGDSLVVLIIRPRYERPVLELVPVALGVFSPNAPDFALSEGKVVRTQGDAFRFRAGGVLLLNGGSFDERQTMSWGVGVGCGLSTSGDHLFPDFLLAGMVSYKDVFRFGVGVGASRLPAGVKPPQTEGAPLIGSAGKVEDVIDTRFRGALYLLVSLTGLTWEILK